MQNNVKYIVAGFLALAGCTLISIGGQSRAPKIPVTNADYAKTAVMIMASNMRSGGTGSILDSHPGASHILTNKHVCQLVQTGGTVVTDNGNTYPVESFRVYKKHDLCLIEVLSDLGINIKVASEPPSPYEPSLVVGHPQLLPTIFTTGHFSQRRTVDVMVDIKPCTGKESDEDAIGCMFLGGIPVVKTFQSQVTSSLIMPGSSGSAVYNSKGELSAVVFAGSQGLSYGFLVPWEYVNDFLNHKSRYPSQLPDSSKPPKSFFTSYFKFQKICEDKIIVRMDNLCKSVANLGIWHQ